MGVHFELVNSAVAPWLAGAFVATLGVGFLASVSAYVDGLGIGLDEAACSVFDGRWVTVADLDFVGA